MQQLEILGYAGAHSAKVCVVDGLGGMGKTQRCFEYVRKQKDDLSAIFWLEGSSKEA
ncbi:hypothetical protein M409DRAFT_38305 [Zasmidium cellare ATCC 36951]|uniref:NB-ARC domain-containing protein n=1 Tax=Zasmidium cellare ATCC 36951 TaxID=1080233 RepID=A0A6A6BU70_ZASCE|nr:uncharacterized protein M409DRAFT_38305 [Zasmidium cellare ATCC 36951]KAF2158354.1 hypothetical protein M409DRAFT_38305 [Zasmidium cellare ATCC 36951]